MKFTKRNLYISAAIVVIAALIQWITAGTLAWIPLANLLFLIALPLLVIGLFGLVLSKGTFDFFHYSMKKVSRSRKKKKDDEDFEDGEKDNLDALSSSVGKSYQSILTIGFIIFIISILLLWDYIF